MSILFVPAFQDYWDISFVDCVLDFRITDLWSIVLPPFTNFFLDGTLQWVLWRMTSNRLSLRASSRFAWSTDVPKMFGYSIWWLSGWRPKLITLKTLDCFLRNCVLNEYIYWSEPNEAVSLKGTGRILVYCDFATRKCTDFGIRIWNYG
jgi:hypothetical protein